METEIEQQKPYKFDKKVYNKEYRIKNADKLKELGRSKKHCDSCNCDISYTNWQKHCTTKKHIKNSTTI